MAIHIAIGLLFLGEGKYTLGSSNASIAALVCAFFPRSNHSQSDNKAYPQAYRHLWALAVEPRCFVAHDIDTGESVYLPIKVKIREDDVVRSLPLIAPTLIPGFDLLLSVKIDSPRYWPINLDLLGNQADRQTLSQNDIVFVKRKSGFLSYDADPKGNRSIFVQAGLIGSAPDLGPMAVEPIEPSSSFSSSKGGALGMLDGQVSSLTSHPLLVSFFRRLCGDHSLSHPSTVLKSFCSAAFLECLISDQPQLLALYLHCRQLLLAQFSTPFLPLVIQNIHLAQRFQASSACYTPVLRSSLLQEVSQSIERLSQTSGAATLLSHYIHQGFEQSLTLPEFERLSVYLHVNQVPSGPVLSVLRQLVSEARRQSIQVGKTSAQEVETLERGLKLVLTTTARKVASGAEWRLGSVEDVLQAWR
jgi:anaphase-promoting complex subunit 1